MKKGDRIFWTQFISGGFGLATVIPGVIASNKIGQILIELREKDIAGRWIAKYQIADKAYLSPRILPCAAFNEPMVFSVDSFILSGSYFCEVADEQFPDGYYCGFVDGYRIHFQCETEEMAIASAYNALVSGIYADAVFLEMELHQGFLKSIVVTDDCIDAENDRLFELQARAGKLSHTGYAQRRRTYSRTLDVITILERKMLTLPDGRVGVSLSNSSLKQYFVFS